MSKRQRADGQNAEWLSPQMPWSPGPGPVKKRVPACVSCRKQKIKCEMAAKGPPCARCVQKNIDCRLNDKLHARLRDQNTIGLLQTDVQNMHEVLQRLCHQVHIDPPATLVSSGNSEVRHQHSHPPQSDTESDENDANESPRPTTPSSTVQAPIDTFMSAAKSAREAIRGTTHSPRDRRIAQPHSMRDIISQGLIKFESAEMLVQRYYAQLDQSLYGIASQYKTIHDLRKASSTLLAAICTVSALHDPIDHELYEICNKEFRRLVSVSLFERRDTDYIRALCIGAFWLSDASRILTSDAVRRAADIRLHSYFYEVVNKTKNGIDVPKVTVSREEARDRIRLWYIMFICDQHLSILHNRDGLLRHEKNILEMWDVYLNCEGGNETDIRLMSQVSILLISNAVRDAFGSEHPEKLQKSLVVQINHFSRQLDDWFVRISEMYNSDPRIGDFPKAGIEMHLQFGKLYLGHHVFRGLRSDPVPLHFLSAATMAYEAAVSIFKMTMNNARLRESLLERPHYVFIMISFAGHFLLEVCRKHCEQLSINFNDTIELIDEVLTVFTQIDQIPQHPITRMSTGLRKKLVDCTSDLINTSSVDATVRQATRENLLQQDGSYQFGSTTIPATGMLPIPPLYFNPDQMPLEDDQSLFADYCEFNFPDMRMNFMG